MNNTNSVVQGGNFSTLLYPPSPETSAVYIPPTPLIYKKMSEVMKEIGAITKAQTNSAQGFKFRGIDQFVNAMYPALVKHGVFMTPECISEVHDIREVVRSNGKAGLDKYVYLQMKYHFYTEDGSSVVVGPVPAEGLDSGDKATNKALSAALKYALIQTFSVPTEDMVEGDAETPVMGTSTVVEASGASNSVSTDVPKRTSSFRRNVAASNISLPSTAVPAETPVATDNNEQWVD